MRRSIAFENAALSDRRAALETPETLPRLPRSRAQRTHWWIKMTGPRDFSDTAVDRHAIVAEALSERDRPEGLPREVAGDLNAEIDEHLRRITRLLPSLSTADAGRWDDLDVTSTELLLDALARTSQALRQMTLPPRTALATAREALRVATKQHRKLVGPR